MRRPTAGAALGVPRESPGLSDMLVSSAELDELLVPIDSEPGLSVLPSGTVPPNSADLLSAGRMAEVLTQARDAADFVIVDSPPLLPVADTRVLLRLSEVDGVVLIGRAGVSRRDRLRAASRLLAQSGLRVFGLVITDVKVTAGSGYYSYDYEEPDRQNGRPKSRPSRPSRVRSPT
jgi:polysaccharide biosynthesis transport protein